MLEEILSFIGTVPGLIFVYFCPFLSTIANAAQKWTIIGESGIRNRDHKMVGADESNERRWYPFFLSEKILRLK